MATSLNTADVFHHSAPTILHFHLDYGDEDEKLSILLIATIIDILIVDIDCNNINLFSKDDDQNEFESNIF